MGNIRLYGSTSGYTELAPPAVAPDGVLALPSGTGTIATQAYVDAKDRASATATVATSQTTTSVTFTDLSTVGPSVTLTTGTKALVIVTSVAYNNVDGNTQYASFSVSGATTISASEANGLATGTNSYQRVAAATLLTNLTAGSNTFTVKYKTGASTATFIERNILVIDLGS